MWTTCDERILNIHGFNFFLLLINNRCTLKCDIDESGENYAVLSLRLVLLHFRHLYSPSFAATDGRRMLGTSLLELKTIRHSDSNKSSDRVFGDFSLLPSFCTSSSPALYMQRTTSATISLAVITNYQLFEFATSIT